MRKTEFLEKKTELSEEKKVKEAKEALKSDFLNKLFKYEINKEVSDIAVIKNLVSDVAFVDLNEKVIRLKFSKDFENKEYEKDDMKVNITKLNKKEVEEYCNKIPVNIKKKDNIKKRKKNSNKDNKKKSEKLTKRTNENFDLIDCNFYKQLYFLNDINFK